MTTFEQLKVPAYKEYANDDTNDDKGWSVDVADVGEFYSLHTDGNLCWYHDSPDTSLFDSELLAFDAAFNYYSSAGKLFPYSARWQDAVARNNGLMPLSTIAQSRVMEFI